MEKHIAASKRGFLSEFECPICTRYMFAPIRQCQNGHCFCDFCFHKIRKCAICRAAKSDMVCIPMQKVQEFLVFPCLYEEEGCSFEGPGSDVSLHQKNCAFAAMPCPLRFNNCEWQGEKYDLIDHCRTRHSGNIFFTNKQKFMSSGFQHRVNRVYYIVFYVFNSIFRCTWDLDGRTGVMRFAVYCLDRSLQKDTFGFEVSYLDKSTDKEVVSFKAPCFPMEDDSERFLKNKYFVLHHESIKNFCDEDGDLNYYVNIFRRM